MFVPDAAPNPFTCSVDVFVNHSTVAYYSVWNKPLHAAFAYFILLGGGGGARRPADGATTNAAGGGGSGGYCCCLVPTILLPDRLYVSAGVGGRGATAANTAGTAGGASLVNIRPDATNPLMLVNGGGASLSTNAAGTAASVVTNSVGILCGFGVYASRPGLVGTIGAAAANGSGTGLTITTNCVGYPGTGGGNGTGSGGNMTLDPAFGGTIAAAPSLGNGANGLFLYPDLPAFFRGRAYRDIPFVLRGGGGGGGGGATGQSGRGGNGDWGCGGGGGGAASAAGGLSGVGGDGGPGFVAIYTW